jgi:type IV secretion system protein VirB10
MASDDTHPLSWGPGGAAPAGTARTSDHDPNRQPEGDPGPNSGAGARGGERAGTAFPVEHEISPVAGTASRLGSSQKIGILLACGVAALGVIAITHLHRHRHATRLPSAPDGGALGRPFQAPPLPPPTRPAITKAALPMPAPHPASPFALGFGHPQETAAMKALKAPIFAYQGGGAVPPPAGTGAPGTAGAAEAISGSGAGGLAGRAAGAGSALARDLTPSRFAHVDARLIAHPNFTLAAGTLIPCTLQTAIDSGLPGFVKCILPQSVRSMTGAVTLLDRGTQVIGQIQQGLIQGQDRLFILWTRAVTPQNVAVDLASPAAGALGRAGVSGAVDNHFMERFGAAIMLSVIGGSLQAASNAAQTGSGNAYFQYLNTNTNQIANTALQSTIDIPPTLRKNQGDNVSIFVARDLNFSRVYKLALVKP